MEENNKNNYTKIIEDSDLEKISGGDLTPQDCEKVANEIAAALQGAGIILVRIGDLLQLIKTAMDTNTCPICNQKIIPGAESCELMDFVQHIKIAHPDGK